MDKYVDLIKWYSKEYCLTNVKKNGMTLCYVKEQTKAICMAAVKQNKYAIKHVDINKFSDVYIYYKLLWS